MGMQWSPLPGAQDPWRPGDISRSTLTLDEGMLTWRPVGIERTDPGGARFDLPLSDPDAAVAEVVWVVGVFALGKFRNIGINLISLCADAPPEHPRRVRAYLPGELIARSWLTPDRAQGQDNGEAFARAIGATFSVHHVELGEDPNATFPASRPWGRGLARMQRFYEGMLLSFALLLGWAGVSWAGGGGVGLRLFPLGMCAFLLWMVVPSYWARHRLRATRKDAALRRRR